MGLRAKGEAGGEVGREVGWNLRGGVMVERRLEEVMRVAENEQIPGHPAHTVGYPFVYMSAVNGTLCW